MRDSVWVDPRDDERPGPGHDYFRPRRRLSGGAAYRLMITNHDWPDEALLPAARYAIVNRLSTFEARRVMDMAFDKYGPEGVYMDGELFSDYGSEAYR